MLSFLSCPIYLQLHWSLIVFICREEPTEILQNKTQWWVVVYLLKLNWCNKPDFMLIMTQKQSWEEKPDLLSPLTIQLHFFLSLDPTAVLWAGIQAVVLWHCDEKAGWKNNNCALWVCRVPLTLRSTFSSGRHCTYTVCLSVCPSGSSPASRDHDLWGSSRKTSWKALGAISAKYAHECSREMHVQNADHRNLLIKRKNFKNEQIV